MEILFGILGLLLLAAFFALPLLIAESWIEKQSIKDSRFNPLKNRHKSLSLYQKIQRIVNQYNNREIVVKRLKQLMWENGYKVSIEEKYFIQFKPISFLSLKRSINITLKNYNKTQRHRTSRKKTSKNTSLISGFEPIIAMLTKIAKSDGVVSELEASVIKDTITHFISIARMYHLSTSELSKLRQKLVGAYKKAKDNNVSIGTYAQKLTKQKLHTKQQLLQQLISMATIDGYTPLKESLIFIAAEALGFNPLSTRRLIDNILGVRQKTPRDVNLYNVLECKSTDDNATIKKKYRELVKKYHPDFMQYKDFDEVEIEFNKKKMQEINNAYDEIKKKRGL